MTTAEAQVPFAELARMLRGSVVYDRGELASLTATAPDAYLRQARAIVQPADVTDVSCILAFSRRYSVPVSVRGSGYSRSADTAPAGIVLLPQPPTPIAMRGDGTALVPASTRWQAAAEQLAAYGAAPPVLTSFLRTTVGGTLSAGGYGIRSIRRGNQLDHVRRVRLVLPDGNVRWYDRDDPAFRFAIGSMGQIGCLDSVEMATVRATPPPRAFFRTHTSLAALVSRVQWLATPSVQTPDVFFSSSGSKDLARQNFREWVAYDDAATTPPPSYGAFGNVAFERNVTDEVSQWLAPFQHHERWFADFVVTYEGLIELAEAADRRLARGTMPHLESVYVLACRNAPRLNAIDGRFGDSPMLFGLGMYFIMRSGDSARNAAARDALRELRDLCIAGGGRPTPYGWHELTRNEMREVYGRDFEAFEKLRDTLDPTGLFNRRW